MVVQAEVVNRGAVATQDVIQVYVKDSQSPYAVPNHSLCAFQRVLLLPGERKVLTIPVRGEAFSAVNEGGLRVQDADRYLLYVGTGQPDRRTQELTGRKSVEVEVRFQTVSGGAGDRH